MADAKYIAGRVQMAKVRFAERDRRHRLVVAMRKGKYDEVAPGLFNTAEFDQPLVANLIDTTARDVAEVMAPLPAFNCQSSSMSEADARRQDMREAIANAYVQNSRLQDQMFEGTDRYGSFGFMAYSVEPDFIDQMPVIRVSRNHTAYYTQDYRGRVVDYAEVYRVHPDRLCTDFPEHAPAIKNKYRDPWGDGFLADQKCEVIRWQDRESTKLVLPDMGLVLHEVPNVVPGKCMVRIVERPEVSSDSPRGQFDDVIWVQVARALVQMYTMNALERSVNAPIVLPKDVQELELGAFSAIQTDNPQSVGTVRLDLAPGLFPEQQILAQEQRVGSRYPEGRSGSIDASIITGQGVQALMGTFDTQVQTFQRLNATALEDVIAMCFEMDEALWPDVKKTVRIKDNGAPRKVDYTPAKDINGDHTVDVTYGAIAGLDPNRGLVFLLQSLAGGLIAKSTARKHLPVDLNVAEEERKIQVEAIDDSIAASLAVMPQVIPQLAMAGQDPRELVLQIVQARKEAVKGNKSLAEVLESVFAPKEDPQAAAPVDPMQQLMQQMGGGGGAPMPGAGQGGASDMLMMLAGMTPGGNPNMQASVSRMQPI